MKITVHEMQFSLDSGAYVGPTFAYCLNPDAPDFGSLLMNVSIANGSDSGVGNMLYRSWDEDSKGWLVIYTPFRTEAASGMNRYVLDL